MSVLEPSISRAPVRGGSNPYQGRWRWWYSAIADWMLRNPGRPLKECAREFRKSENTIYYITGSEVFRDYFARRKAEWSRDHDFALRSKLTRVAELTLDATVEKLQSQRDKTALPVLTELLTSSLDRLGFAPQTGPQVQINQQIGDNRNQVVQLPGSVTVSALEQAREALRAAEQLRSLPSRGAEPLPGSVSGDGPLLELEPEGGQTSGGDSSVGS